MNLWGESRDEVDGGDMFDPLCIQRSAPMNDDEAALAEALCQAATPGPLVVDDEAEGQGAVVVTLPDGRLIVSLTASVEHARDGGAIHANAELICKARFLLLRLLRDREQWKEQREFLLERIRTLETALGPEKKLAEREGWDPTSRFSARPR